MNIKFSRKANGKLLLSGEYLVLNGAKALAVPLKYGQQFSVDSSDEDAVINWKSTVNGNTWFAATFCLQTLKLKNTTDTVIATELLKILQATFLLNPDFFKNQKKGLNINIEANYPLQWGLGSSSTLIYLIASWLGIDKFQLYSKVSNGSGYDLACAAAANPLFYQLIENKAVITNVEIGTAIKNHAVFAWLGKKQNSHKEVENYIKTNNATSSQINRISELSEAMCHTTSAKELINIIKEHEQIISEILKRESIAKQNFPDFDGGIKSLGAWGGDFAMFVSEKSNIRLKEELKTMGFNFIFSYDEIITNTDTL